MKSGKKFYIPFLIAFVALVWLVNAKFFKTIVRYDLRKEAPVDNDPPVAALPPFDACEFKPLKRDPFNAVMDTGPVEPVMPMFTLNGVVISKTGALALMALPDGKVYPLKKGETYLGVKIKDITPRQVCVEFRGKKVVFDIIQ